MMYTLVINCGSSSLKFALVDSETKITKTSGLAENLGSDNALISIKWEGEQLTTPLAEKNHLGAVKHIFDFLQKEALSQQIEAVGHRVVHGADLFSEPALINDEVIAGIEACNPLAPLHNPAHLIGIRAAMSVLSELPHVAVFDTSFHQTMPKKAYLYALPLELYHEHSVRRYGFHGSSHRYITERTAELLNKPVDELNLISAHLGNGASVTAIKEGRSIDTSMGLTPLEGLVMGTRSGTIDPGIFRFLANELNMGIEEIDSLLNKKSGLLGLSGLSNDCRTLQESANAGNEAAALALQIFIYRIAKTIASYLVPLPHVDAIAFTGGIGENSAYIRSEVIKELTFMHYTLDEEANNRLCGGNEGVIATSDYFGKAMVVCTDEEAMIVRETLALIR